MADQKDRTRFFFGVFCVLVMLTIASFVVGSTDLVSRQETKWAVMIGISVAKAAFVILFFMHFWWERSWKYLLTIPTSIMALILVVALIPDIMERVQHYSNSRLDHAARAGAYLTPTGSDTDNDEVSDADSDEASDEANDVAAGTESNSAASQ